MDAASLVFFRVAFGAIMLWEVWRYLYDNRVERYWIEPKYFFTFEWFPWVKPWPGDGMYVHWIALGVLSVLIMAGALYRVAMTLFFLGFTYIFLLDKANYLNHFYLICLISFIMIFLPMNRTFAIDAWLRPKTRSQTVPAWALWLVRFQIAIPYIYGGIAKCNNDWLLGEPMHMWLADRTDFPVIGHLFTQEWMVMGMSYAGLLLDLFIVPFLLWRKTRWLAFGFGLTFHLMNAQLFSIGIFPWFMIAATLMFFEPDWPRRWMFWKQNRARVCSDVEVQQPSGVLLQWTRWRRATVVLLAIWCFFQVALPFRHHLYPGNVNWTEEGHRFSWHMKLRSKRGEVLFYAKDTANQRIWRVDHRTFLSHRQRRKMTGRPDMIVQFSRFLADHIREEHGVEVSIHAYARVSLNGREPQLLIDPEVDLSKERWHTLSAAPWIVPLEKPLPRFVRQ